MHDLKAEQNSDRPVNMRPAGMMTGLSAKLLFLTLVFVMIAEVLIFVPSIANFRNVWLRNHLDTAEAASIVYLDTPDAMLSENAGEDLLQTTQAETVAIRSAGASRMMATRGDAAELVEHIDLDASSAFGSIRSALPMLFKPPEAKYRVFAKMISRDATIELVQKFQPIQRAMWIYARNVLILSIIISMFTAGLVYLALYWLIVRPIIRISSNMDRFSKAPENASLIYKPGNRRDEIGVAEKRLAAFQGDLQNTLRQKRHLAELGLAVSKINHDLRNILASAQLFSDRLTSLPDPTVQRFAPKLIRTIDRAVNYTKSVIDYGRALEVPPKRRKLLLRNVVNDVAELLGLENSATINWRNDVSPDFEADADPEQLFRILMNLCRNAQQAMLEIQEKHAGLHLSVSADRKKNQVHIFIRDTGPGIPGHIREKIFNAFQGSTKTDGSGLGLTIAAELVHAHGGTIEIAKTSSKGTILHLVIPDTPVEGNNNPALDSK